MFDNVGSRMKGLAKVVFAVILIAALVGAILSAIAVGKAAAISCNAERYVYSGEKDEAAGVLAGIGTFVAVMLAGFFSAYFTGALVYAVGEAVENSEAAKKAAEQNRAMLLKLTGSGAGSEAPATKQTVKDAPPAAKKDAVVLDDTKMRCPKCGAVQPKGRSVCWDCGMRFTAEEAPAAPAKTDAWFCVSCGKKNEASAKFCMRCGTPKV